VTAVKHIDCAGCGAKLEDSYMEQAIYTVAGKDYKICPGRRSYMGEPDPSAACVQKLLRSRRECCGGLTSDHETGVSTMQTKYYFPGTPTASGSGIHAGEFNTRAGRIRFIHWRLSDGDKTTIELAIAESGAPRFEVHYPGHDDISATNAWVKFLGKMLEIAGPVFVLDLVECVENLYRAVGAERACADVRAALGL